MVIVTYGGELYHHGIKGQKWGVRRFQNPDGTLTDAGKKRYLVKLYKEDERSKAQHKTFDRTLKKMEKDHALFEAIANDPKIKDSYEKVQKTYRDFKDYVKPFNDNHDLKMTKKQSAKIDELDNANWEAYKKYEDAIDKYFDTPNIQKNSLYYAKGKKLVEYMIDNKYKEEERRMKNDPEYKRKKEIEADIGRRKTALNNLGYHETEHGYMEKEIKTPYNNKGNVRISIDSDPSTYRTPEESAARAKTIEKDIPKIHKAATESLIKNYYDSEIGEEWLRPDEYVNGKYVPGKKISKEQFIKNLELESIDEYSAMYYSPDFQHWLNVEYNKDKNGKYKTGYTSMDG